MSKKKQVRTSSAPQPRGPYSQGIAGAGLVFTAGQGPVHPHTGMVPDGIEAQTRQALENVSAILAAAGASLADVVKVTVHLADLQDFDRFNQVYASYFDEPRPARTTVGSQLLGILVEIDAVAVVPA